MSLLLGDAAHASYVSCGGAPNVDHLTEFAARLETIDSISRGWLRTPRQWHVHLWQSGVHRALVFCPKRVENFELPVMAEVATDLTSLTACLDACDDKEPETLEWGIVLELFVDSGGTFSLRVGVLYGFEPTDDGFTSLGFSRPIAFAQDSAQALEPAPEPMPELALGLSGFSALSSNRACVAQMALNVIAPYTRYGVVGTNCQHFVRELGVLLHLSDEALALLVPQDEVAVHLAASSFGGFIVGGTVASRVAAQTVTSVMVKPAWGILGWMGLKTKVAVTVAAHSPPYIAAAGATGAVVGATVSAAVAGTAYMGLQQSQRGGGCCCGGRATSIH